MEDCQDNSELILFCFEADVVEEREEEEESSDALRVDIDLCWSKESVFEL